MLELPEVTVFKDQANKLLAGKVITEVFPPTNLHKFAFFNGDPLAYKDLLTGRKILSANGKGMFINIVMDNDTVITLGDGVNTEYGEPSSDLPKKYQLLLTFDDESFLVFTIAMYGMIYAFKGEFDNKYYTKSMESISPLSEEFDRAYFEKLFANEKKDISAKAFLASEQRIPGVGNGVLQDILFNAKINPKRKIFSLSDEEKENIFRSLKSTLKEMTDKGGRDTEKDIYGNKGGYKTILSKNTYKDPCPACGGIIVKEAYMGGSVYYCPTCQKK